MAYTKKKIDSIFKDIITFIKEGNSLGAALRRDGMPCDNTFDKWCNEDADKMTEYTHAREKRADVIFEQILVIADDSSGDRKVNEKGDEIMDSEFVARSRLMVDARKWMLGKMQPKIYGDRTILAGDEENPLFNHTIPLVLSDGRSFDDLKNELKPE